MNPTKSIFAIIMLAASNWYYLHVSAADATSTSHHEATSSEHEIRIIGKDGKLSDKVALTPDDTLVCAIIKKTEVDRIVLEQNSKTTPVVLGGKLEAVPSNSVSQEKEEKIETSHKESKSDAVESEKVKAAAPVSGEGAVKPPPPTSANETSSTVHETKHENETIHKSDSSIDTSSPRTPSTSNDEVSSTSPAGINLDSNGLKNVTSESSAHITITEGNAKSPSTGETETGSLTDSTSKVETSPLNSVDASDKKVSERKLTNTGNLTDHEIDVANKQAALTSGSSGLEQLIELQKGEQKN